MKHARFRLILILLSTVLLSCDGLLPGPDEPPLTDERNIGTLDMAFVCHISGIPANRLKKVELSLAYTADYLYNSIFFVQTNVSDAVVHYRFDLPPGDYFYYAKVICLCAGDSCLYAGFSGQYGTVAAGGKVSVEKGKISSYTTNFH